MEDEELFIEPCPDLFLSGSLICGIIWHHDDSQPIEVAMKNRVIEDVERGAELSFFVARPLRGPP